MKIAIVGSGISGLVCAHLLHREHEITVFEADDRIGGHTSTVELEVGDEHVAVDTGFIVYNERTYPHFIQLLDQLGVATQPSDMSFGVQDLRAGLEWGSRGWNGIFAQRKNAIDREFWRMLGDVARFNREAGALIDGGDEKTSLGEYLRGAGYSDAFASHYIVPMGAAIWSADPEAFLAFPAASFVRFFHNHGLLARKPDVPWRVISGGSHRYVEALTAPFLDRIRLSSPVVSIEREEGRVRVFTTAVAPETFDHVILALHSDQALRILAEPTKSEREILGRIRYQSNDTVLHTDRSVMPRSPRAWASWNYRIPAGERDGVFVTYHMNRLQSLRCREDLFVTLNGSSSIDERQVLARFHYHHPVFDAEAMAAQKARDSIDGVGRTHYCGAYWGYGFHEDGVNSALHVCQRFGASLES